MTSTTSPKRQTKVTFKSSPNSTERKAKSSIDLRSSSNDSHTSPPPPTSKRRFWSSFRKKKVRKQKYVKGVSDKDELRGLSASQPNIVNHAQYEDKPMHDEMVPIFSSTDTNNPLESSPDRSLSDPSISPAKVDPHPTSRRYNRPLLRTSSQSQSADELEKEDEGDSGIAVIESTAISMVRVWFFWSTNKIMGLLEKELVWSIE
ncbi:hypothetical protein FSP39_020059 [Pinctada imbricata]|uniref:Uncharacterized protein n=1 Tax=Pinctada imbricata TaxID=66713 RepID=A0AA88Y4T9_PINIB|nr:hypothetical protein FSP39_020059 [Pinctada imbricata]